jgi:glycolate oxidase iron-sulfur subunit
MSMTAPFSQDPAPARRDCTLCGRCLSACPLFAATGREELSPRAKFLLLSRLSEGDSGLPRRAAEELAGLCLSCGRCQEACPVGLCVPEAVGRLRAAHPGWPGFVWRQWITRAKTLWPMAQALSRHVPAVLSGTRVAAALAGLDPGRAGPPWLVPTRFNAASAGRPAAVFPGCVAAHARTDWTRAATRLLQGLGVVLVKAPEFSCCGATLGHAGLPEAQDAARRANITAWRDAGRPTLAVFCASCHHGLTRYPDGLFEPGEAAAWAAAIVPLARLMGRTECALSPSAPTHIRYHAPCHAPPGDPDRVLLARLLQLPQPHGQAPCCGFGGLMQLTAPDLSARTAARCWSGHAPSPGATVLTSCSGCAVQLAATAPQGIVVDHWLGAVVCP